MVRGGGIGGLVSTTTVDSEKLAPEDAELLRAKVGEAGVFDLPPESGAETMLVDAPSYEIAVEEGGRRQRVLLSEEALPEKARSLISWLDSIPEREERIHPPGGE